MSTVGVATMTRSESPHRKASAAVQRRLKERDGRLSSLLVNNNATSLSGADYAAVQKELQENQKMEQEAASMRLLLQQQAEAAERAQAQRRQQMESAVMQRALQQQQQQQAPAAAQAQRMEQQQAQGQGTHNQQRGQNTTEEPDPFATFVEDRGNNDFTASSSWLENADVDDGWTTVSRTTPKVVNEDGSHDPNGWSHDLSYAQMQQIQYQEHHERYKREQAALYVQAQQRHYQQQQQALQKQAEVLAAAKRQQQQAHDPKQPSELETTQQRQEEPKHQAPPPADSEQQVQETPSSSAGNKSRRSSGAAVSSTSSGHRPVPLRQNSRRRVLPRMSANPTNPRRTQPQETELGHGRGLGNATRMRPSYPSDTKRGQASSDPVATKMAQTPTPMSTFSFGAKGQFSQNHVWSIVVDTPPGHCMSGGRGLELVEECSAENESQERSVGWHENRRKQKIMEQKVLKAAAGADPSDGGGSVSSSSVSSGSGRRRKHRRGTYRKSRSFTRRDNGIANNPASDSEELDPVDEDDTWDWELSDTSSECETLDCPMSGRSLVDDYNDRIKRKEAAHDGHGVGATSVPISGSSYDAMLKKKSASNNGGSCVGFTAVSGAPDDAALKKKNACDRAASGVGVTLVKGPPPKHPDNEELRKIQNGEGALYEDFAKKAPLARTIRMKLRAPGRRVCGWLKTHKMKPVNTPVPAN